MFAYCGNIPVNYSDPSGHAYQGIYSQINYNEYEHMYGGLRENFYCLYDIERVIITKGQALVAVYSASYTCGMTALPYAYPGIAYAIMVVGYYESYDKCRMSGLGQTASFWIALISFPVANFPYDELGSTKNILKDLGFAFAAQGVEDILIERALQDVTQADRIQNRQTYTTNKNASVAVGGGFRYMYTDYTGMRRDLFGNP